MRQRSRFQVLGGRPSGLRQERMQASARWRDGQFHNTHPVTAGLQGHRLELLGEYVRGGPLRRPPAPLPLEDPRATWARPSEEGLRITWLGHSTLLLELDGVRLLTDPVFGERASPFGFSGPSRFHPTPIPIDALGSLDAVLVSHDHYDHLCMPTIHALARTGVPFVTALGVGAHLEAFGVDPSRITELDWWEEAFVADGRLRLTATPAQHFSGRAMRDRNRTLWASWALRSERHHVFFSGDTGLTPEFEEIGRRLDRFDVVMLEIGAFHPAWGGIHLGPQNALSAHAMLGSGALLPVHWGTFTLGTHAWSEPAETLVTLAQQRDVRLLTPRLGRPFEPSKMEGIDPWWRSVGGVILKPDQLTQPPGGSPSATPDVSLT